MLLNQSIGPSPKEISLMKEDEGQMALIESLGEKYGGSFDVKLNLQEENGDFNLVKYLRINPDIAIQFTEELDEDPDISVNIDYDSLYDFIIYMTTKFEGDKIEGPYWVNIEEDKGPGDFFGALGAISKFWREGITITPKYSIIRLFFDLNDFIELMALDDSTDSLGEDKGIKITGEAISER